MKTYEFYTVNVFSEDGIRGGNQLGVVLDAGDLSDEEMQIIAKQFNYSESTFITSMNDNGASVRIFLPEREIPFAGHPTIGTAFIVEKVWRENNHPRENITLQLKKGPIDIRIDENFKCTMDQFEPKSFGVFEERGYISELLGITENDLMDKDILKVAPSDLPFIFVPVKSLEVMKTLKPDLSRLVDEYERIQGEPYVYTVTDDGVRGRLFAPKSGIAEDPATGSAQASLAYALLQLGLINHPESGSYEFKVEQGIEMGRPSYLYNTINVKNNKLLHTKTSGTTYLVSKGILYI